MKKHFFLLLLSMMGIAAISWAQVPQAIPYQGVARNAAGNILASQAIGLRISLREGTAAGAVVYSETHNPTTTALGLFTVNIGQGTALTGTLAGVNWGSGAKFIQVEMDAAGGTAYTDMGTTQLNSVPYALFAGSSASLPNGAASGNTLRWNGTAWVAENTLTNTGTNVGVGTATPDASAIIDASSTTKGFLMPRMTTAQRDAIADPAVGLQVFNLDDHCTDLYDGSNWIKTCGLKVTGPATDPAHPTPNSWAQKANFTGGRRSGAIAFSIGSKGYAGTGGTDEFWEYDPSINAWTQKANFAGGSRKGAVGFSIGSKGYAGTGSDELINKSDFWEYDPATNDWTQKAGFGGGVRTNAVGFSMGTKGYIGTGQDGSTDRNDFWEYDPVTDTWTQKANFAGGQRRGAIAFSIGSKGYAGTGDGSGVLKNDFWEYDPATNSWTQKANFGGSTRVWAVGFSFGGKGFIGTGFGTSPVSTKNDFWEYNPASDSWTRKADFGGIPTSGAFGFAIGNKGYIGSGTMSAEFWEYMDNNIAGIALISNLPVTPGNTVSDGAWTLANGTVYNANPGNVGIGTANPATAASLDISSTTKGFLMPRMTTQQRDSILSPVVGLQIFNLDDHCTDIYDGANWIKTCGFKVKGTFTNSIDSIPGKAYSSEVTTGWGPYYTNSYSNGAWTLANGKVYNANSGNVGIGTATPAVSALLDVNSTTGGFLMPRMTSAQRDAIANPAVGLQIFNLDDHCTDIFDGQYWIKTCGLKVTAVTQDPEHATPDSWLQKAGFGGSARSGAVGFSIGGKGYIGTGWDGSYKNDFWEYNPLTNGWTQKANFNGGARSEAVGFSIDSLGYIGTGWDGGYKNDFWEYNPIANVWMQKASIAGGSRSKAVGFSIGSKGYLGTGTGITWAGGQPVAFNDFWEYDPASDAWTKKADFGGGYREDAVGFSIVNKGFIGTGFYPISTAILADFWEYDPGSDSWTRKADFAGGARRGAVGLAIGGKGYVGTGLDSNGYINDFWEFNVGSNAWVQKAEPGNELRYGAVGFSINNKGFIGTGLDSNGNRNDFWQFMGSNVTPSAYRSAPLSNGLSVPITNGEWTSVNGNVYNANSGNVGIGTSSPMVKLDVAGNVKIADGTQGAGRLFTSDANGVGSWQVNPWTQDNNHVYTANSGNLGIGTSAPSAKLDVAGNIKIADGTQGFGKVLTSDANGFASWQVSVNNLWAQDNGHFFTINSGNLGIGTSAPSAKLDVAGNIKIADGTQGSGRVLTSDANGFASWQVNPWALLNNHAFTTNTGNVGIGTSAPTAKLDVAGNVKIADGTQGPGKVLTSDAYGLATWLAESDPKVQSGIWNAIPRFNGSLGVLSDGIMYDDGSNIGIGTFEPKSKLDVEGGLAVGANYSGTHAAPANGAIIEGRLGIGTNLPNFPLHISGAASGTPLSTNAPESWFNPNSVLKQSASAATSGISIYATNYIASSVGFVAHSDSRLKNITGISSTSNDLKTLNKIEITDYTLRDLRADNSPFKKVIAQQVQSVYPQAVKSTQSPDFIANLYQLAANYKVNGNQITIALSKAIEEKDKFDVTAGAKIKLYLNNSSDDKDMKQVEGVIEALNGNTLTVSLEDIPAGFNYDKVFVYGTRVSNILSVDYEALTTLNISATQQLAKQLEAQQKQIELLKKQNEAMEKQKAETETRLKVLEDKLNKLSGTVTSNQ